MALKDYAHWNEEAEQVWWQEEGRHAEEPYSSFEDEMRESDADDAFAEEVAEMDTDSIVSMLADPDYCARWPKAIKFLKWELEDRGVPEDESRGHH